jgi:integral membrane protein (TIGR01906 family)
LANEPRVYRYAVVQFGAEQATGIERSELLRANDELRAYFNNGQDTVQIRVQQDGREVSLFNPRETTHLKDVKSLYRNLNRLQEFTLLYCLVYVAAVVLWAREVSLRGLALSVVAGGVVGLAALAVVTAAVVGLSGFDTAWDEAHQLVFSNELYRLNPLTDHLIQMFPPDFWSSITFFLGLLSAAEAAFLIVGALIYLGASARQARHQLEPHYA